jgi:hypothetical protein
LQHLDSGTQIGVDSMLAIYHLEEIKMKRTLLFAAAVLLAVPRWKRKIIRVSSSRPAVRAK